MLKERKKIDKNKYQCNTMSGKNKRTKRIMHSERERERENVIRDMK